MEVIVKKNYEEMSKAAATLFAAEIMENPKTPCRLPVCSPHRS